MVCNYEDTGSIDYNFAKLESHYIIYIDYIYIYIYCILHVERKILSS
jgi:hypothetical protein